MAPPLWWTKPYTIASPRPGALPLRLGREERIEDPRFDVLRDPHARVAHEQRDEGPGLEAQRIGVRLRQLAIGGLDDQLPAGRHRVARVDAEIDDRLLQLRRVGAHRPHIGRRGADRW